MYVTMKGQHVTNDIIDHYGYLHHPTLPPGVVPLSSFLAAAGVCLVSADLTAAAPQAAAAEQLVMYT